MLRFGIVGAGGIATKFARDIALVPNATITAVAARSEARAKAHQAHYKVKHAFASYEAMAKSDTIDAVYIATPHSFHYEQALLFMKHQKHVLIEKPIAVNEKQLTEMIQVAKDNKVLMMEAMWTHFLPASQYVKHYLNTNDTGKLKEAKIDFGYALIDDYPKEKRLLNKALAGGSLLDIGVYPISFYHFIQKAKIKAIDASAEMTDTGVDANCLININDDNDALIQIRSSIKETLPNNALLIYEESTIKMIDFSRSSEIYINDEKHVLPFLGEGFPHQIKAFADTIEMGLMENPIMTYDASMQTIKTMDRVRQIIGLTYPFE